MRWTWQNIALVMALVVCLIVIPAAVANAATGCTVRYDRQLKDKAVHSATLDPTDSVIRRTNVRWSTRMYYRWCKNGTRPDTVQFLSMMFCGRKLDSGAAFYVTGIKFGMSAFDGFGIRMSRQNGWLKWNLVAGPYWYAKCKYYDFGDGPIMRRAAKPIYNLASRAVISFQRDLTIHGVGSTYQLGYAYDERLR